MVEQTRCVSMGTDISNDGGSVQFKCPSCGDATIVRSREARRLASKYKCPVCGFEGPN